MKLTKEQAHKLNAIAAENFEKAQGMLDGINMVLGTEYGSVSYTHLTLPTTSRV